MENLKKERATKRFISFVSFVGFYEDVCERLRKQESFLKARLEPCAWDKFLTGVAESTRHADELCVLLEWCSDYDG